MVILMSMERFAKFFSAALYIAFLPALMFMPIDVDGAGQPAAPAIDMPENLSCPRPKLETLHYEFGWNNVIAANAKVQIKEEVLANEPVMRITGDAHTIGMARNLWKMDDRMEAVIHRDSFSPIRVELNRLEGADSYRTTSVFSGNTNTATVIDVDGASVKKKQIKYGKAYEPLTLILLVRCMELSVGKTVTFDLLETDTLYRVELKVLSKEPVKVKSGSYQAFKITPTFYKIKKNQIKKEDIKAEQVFIWVADIPERYMVKVTSKVFIGAVTGELARVEK